MLIALCSYISGYGFAFHCLWKQAREERKYALTLNDVIACLFFSVFSWIIVGIFVAWKVSEYFNTIKIYKDMSDE